MNTFTAIKAWLRVKFMYGIIVPEYKGMHWAWDYLELSAWVDCYPADTLIIPCGLLWYMWKPNPEP